MVLVFQLVLLCWILFCQTAADNCRGTQCKETGDPRPCIGAHCPSGRVSRPPHQFNPVTQGRVGSQFHAYPSSPSTQRQSSRSSNSGTREGCTDADCTALSKHFHTPSNDTRDCRGIECRLPLRIRPRTRARSCVGEGCVSSTAPEDRDYSHPVHMSDRAAQFLGDFPEFGYPSPELGSAPLGVQLTCDIKPGLFPSLKF